jgi:hypothetical protein
MDDGIDWIQKTFPFMKNKVKTIWQIDPFGSSALTPLLFNQQYKYALLNRIGDQIKD